MSYISVGQDFTSYIIEMNCMQTTVCTDDLLYVVINISLAMVENTYFTEAQCLFNFEALVE